MQLSDRLKKVISFVSPCKTVADIGTDHGYVPIELVKTGVAEFAYAMDINKGPLQRAKEHIEQEGLADKITVRQSDGLEMLQPGEADTLIIAGMGGELTVKILTEGRHVLKNIQEMVLSPHSEPHVVRKYLIQEGYEIAKEEMLCDAGKYYTVMKAVPSQGKDLTSEYSEEIYYLYGKKLIEQKHPVFIRYIREKKEKLLEILNTLDCQDSMSAKTRKRTLEEEIKEIDIVLDMMEQEV